MKPMILTDIIYVKEDSLSNGHPYIPAVRRPCHSLAVITSGRMRYTVDNRSILLSSGDVLFIREGSMDIAETASDSPVHFITVDFCSLAPEEEMTNLYHCDNKDLFPLFVKLLTVFREYGENGLMEEFEILYRILNSLRKTDSQSMEQDAFYLRISEAVQMIQDRIGDPSLTVRELADACEVSSVTLNRYFRKVYGMPVSAFLSSQRMKLAKMLLLNSSNSVADVAKKVGYGDIYAFSHAFIRCFGVAPSVWRNR